MSLTLPLTTTPKLKKETPMLIPIEQAITVGLTDTLGNDLTVVNAARVSFDKQSDWESTIEDSIEGQTISLKHTLKEKDKGLIRFLAREKHITPFRHVQLQLRCKAPIFIARQLGKAQVGFSWNEVSRRYVSGNPTFYEPSCWRKCPEDGIKQGSSDECVEIIDKENKLTANYKYFKAMSKAALTYDEMVKAKVAPEMARMVLPQSMITEWVWTGSLYGFYTVYRQRIDSHSQKEAQYFAKILDKVIPDELRFSWETLKGYNP